MLKNKVQALLNKRELILKKAGADNPESIELLKDIVQCYVEMNDDISACRYQKIYCAALSKLLGEDNIRTERAGLYLRELEIRSAPLPKRVTMCRSFWDDVRHDYGDSSLTLKAVFGLFIACCWDAQDIEELRILCEEAIAIYENRLDEKSREIVSLCKKFSCVSGEESSSIPALESACKEVAAQFGYGSKFTLTMFKLLGQRYRKLGGPDNYKKALEIHENCLIISHKAFQKNSYISLFIEKEIVLDYISLDRLSEALKKAEELEVECDKLSETERKPDVDECFFWIYSHMGQHKKAFGYIKKLHQKNRRQYADEDFDTLDIQMKYALALAMTNDTKGAITQMSEYMKVKEKFLCNIFSVRSTALREVYFTVNDKNTYAMFLTVIAQYGLEASADTSVLLDAWEVACNYKNLLGDCEFLHSAIKKNGRFASELALLDDEYAAANHDKRLELEKKYLAIARTADFSGYFNSINVCDVRRVLRDDEILLDYYLSELSGGSTYVLMISTNKTFSITELSDADAINNEINLLIKLIKQAGSLSKSRAGDENELRYKNEIKKQVCLLADALGVSNISLSGVRHVIVCPDGMLYRMSFDLVFDRDIEVVYATNIKDVARARLSGSGQSEYPVQSVSVFAFPDYEINDIQDFTTIFDSSQERNDEYHPLPGTYIEACVISRIFGERAKLFLHKDATVESLCRECNADILHIGSHAGTDDCGTIYLAGIANAKNGDSIGPQYGKGCITAKEIATLNMTETRLAVLSACQTAIGQYREYIGLRGLGRAFKLAGVKSVITTLWEISDIATAVFMMSFYGQYGRTGNAHDALMFAKKHMQEATIADIRTTEYPLIAEILILAGQKEAYREFRDIINNNEADRKLFAEPFYWAGFVLFD